MREGDRGSALIAGAGIVGIAAALWLQRDGWSVTLVDPFPAAEAGASAGNAGLIAVHIARPIGMPGIWRKVPSMLMDPEGPLSIRWSYAPRIAPWLIRLLAASRPLRVEAIACALQTELANAWAAYEPLIKSAGAEKFIRRDGVFAAYRTEADLRRNQFEVDLLTRVGVRLERLTGAQLRERVGDLSPDYEAGMFFPDSGHTVEPLALARALFQDFLERGGRFRQASVDRFLHDERRVVAAVIGGEHLNADLFVCAAGAWSRNLCRSLGLRVPLDTERGYHVTLTDPGVAVKAPVILSDKKFAVTPMAPGLRLAGTIEFGGMRAPATLARFKTLLRGAKQAFPGIDTSHSSRWMGFRPSLPDSLPIIGRSPRHTNMYLAFGHGHLGLTSAGVTGKAVADLAAGRPTEFDLTPFRADRFGWL